MLSQDVWKFTPVSYRTSTQKRFLCHIFPYSCWTISGDQWVSACLCWHGSYDSVTIAEAESFVNLAHCPHKFDLSQKVKRRRLPSIRSLLGDHPSTRIPPRNPWKQKWPSCLWQMRPRRLVRRQNQQQPQPKSAEKVSTPLIPKASPVKLSKGTNLHRRIPTTAQS